MFIRKGRRPFKPVDFMAHKGQHSGVKGGQVVKRAWQEQLLIVERLNVAFKGKDTRTKAE